MAREEQAKAAETEARLEALQQEADKKAAEHAARAAEKAAEAAAREQLMGAGTARPKLAFSLKGKR